MLQSKNHKQLLEPFSARSTAAKDFLLSIRPSLEIEVGALVDPQVILNFGGKKSSLTVSSFGSQVYELCFKFC